MWLALAFILGIVVTAAVAVWLAKHGIAAAIGRSLNW